MSKPKYLYHGSPNKNIQVFAPRNKTARDEREGLVLFATISSVAASVFMVPSDDSWSQLSRFNNTQVAIYSDKKKFIKLDKGGSIYKLSSKDFSRDSKFGGGKNEWTTRISVKPISKIDYDSGLEAMTTLGVQVYFTDHKTLNQIQSAPDHGLTTIKQLESENMKLRRNVINLP